MRRRKATMCQVALCLSSQYTNTLGREVAERSLPNRFFSCSLKVSVGLCEEERKRKREEEREEEEEGEREGEGGGVGSYL